MGRQEIFIDADEHFRNEIIDEPLYNTVFYITILHMCRDNDKCRI